jgi:integrase
MSIHRRTHASGVSYVVRYREGDRNRSRAFRTKRDAQAFDTEQTRRKRMGAHAPAEPSPMLLEDYLVRWIATSGPTWETSTLKRRAPMLDRWVLPYIGDVPLRELGRARVSEFRAEIVRAGSPPVNTNNVLRVLSAALGDAVKDNLIPGNPCSKLGKMPEPPTERQAFHPQTVPEMIAAMPTPRDRMIVAIGAYAGLRPGEIVALRWMDIADGVIHVQRSVQDGRVKLTKGLHSRTVPVDAELERVLRANVPEDAIPDDLIALPIRGEFLNWGIWTKRVWHPAITAPPKPDGTGGLGMKGIPYDLRHTAASTWIIRDGLDLLTVAARLGHGAEVTLRHYAHLFERSRQRSARASRKVPEGRLLPGESPLPPAEGLTGELGSGSRS